MRRLVNYFLQGLVVIAPLALTVYVVWLVFSTIDRWLGIPIPGVGFVLTVLVITVVGFLASNLLARGMLSAIESLMNRLPFVRLLYSSTKDLLNAFVGEKRRFDKPVVVSLTADGTAKALGFVTQDSLAHLGLTDHIAVYLPQSYNFAGNLLLFPSHQVAPLTTESAAIMAFIVSGGVTGPAR
ncbi:MAG TPA: DUF502 domain-containing protein [Gemmatimonadaceae bacterium]|nr:DUF502 domain-containing protein [Gemmatimonadaceae bacterium]